jgi:hypothetical protein
MLSLKSIDSVTNSIAKALADQIIYTQEVGLTQRLYDLRDKGWDLWFDWLDWSAAVLIPSIIAWVTVNLKPNVNESNWVGLVGLVLIVNFVLIATAMPNVVWLLTIPLAIRLITHKL